MTHHDHIASVTQLPVQEYQPSLIERGMDFVYEHSTAAKIALGVVAATALYTGLNETRGGSNDPGRFEHTTNVTSVHLSEGGNVRYDPYVDTDTPPIETLSQDMTITTPDGTYQHAEFHNGNWIGVKATDIPNFDAQGDKDGIVWINEQTATTAEK